METKIKTFSGKTIDFRNPDPEQICIQDIAIGLAHTCRFSGQTGMFYSVAQHSVMCADLVPDRYKLEALLHDASEAYMSDIVKPLKNLLPDYEAIENKFMTIIAKKFGFNYPLSRQIKEADAIMLSFEMESIVNRNPYAQKPITLQGSKEAYNSYINTYLSILK